jgi:hypothetical protein
MVLARELSDVIRIVVNFASAADTIIEAIDREAKPSDPCPPCAHAHPGGYVAGSHLSNRPQVERDDISSNRHPALAFCWSMIFSENRYPLFGIML